MWMEKWAYYSALGSQKNLWRGGWTIAQLLSRLITGEMSNR